MLATTRTGGVRRRGGRLEGGLVVAQMALAVLLAAGAGLLIRSVANLRAIDPGINVNGVVVVDATMPRSFTAEDGGARSSTVLPALEACPGVEPVAARRSCRCGAPATTGASASRAGRCSTATTAFRMVTPRLFRDARRFRSARGRASKPSDREGTDRVVVINEALAAKFFRARIRSASVLLTFDDRGERVVGVVGNAAEANLTDAPVPARYMLYEHVPPVWHQVSFVLRTDCGRAHPGAARCRAIDDRQGRPPARGAADDHDEELFDLALGPTGQVVTLLSLLAGLALVLGAVGVYGVISHYVTAARATTASASRSVSSRSRVVRQVVGRGVGARRARQRDRHRRRPRRSRACSPHCSTACSRPIRCRWPGRRRAARRRHAGRVRAGPPRQPDGSRRRAAADRGRTHRRR